MPCRRALWCCAPLERLCWWARPRQISSQLMMMGLLALGLRPTLRCWLEVCPDSIGSAQASGMGIKLLPCVTPDQCQGCSVQHGWVPAILDLSGVGERAHMPSFSAQQRCPAAPLCRKKLLRHAATCVGVEKLFLKWLNPNPAMSIHFSSYIANYGKCYG